MIERIQEARDWQLLHRNAGQKNPFFEWVLKHGFHGIQLSVPHWKAYLREVFWMHKFGRLVLLNKYHQDFKIPRWSWLLKVKGFQGQLHKQSKVTATTDETDWATHFVYSMSTTLTLEEPLRLIIDLCLGKHGAH